MNDKVEILESKTEVINRDMKKNLDNLALVELKENIILLNLLKCVLIFYLVYYIVLCFCFTAFRIQMLDGFAPFDFKTKPSWFNPYYLVLIISMEIAYVISGLLFALLVEEWVWDYAITITIIHITVTSAVMAEFPLMLHWWAALGSGLILMICSGQCLAFYLFKDNFIYPVLDDF
ncbi:transmembrane protein 244 [Ahaetulla prasina]|uniref:transmembrane protein 244 n=1 Tax=Ahaetulla prasina TaxID=499056 RepID=UPI00264986C6|nr:transmembrane protein 244 [Ahaetulla prasina]